MSALRTIQSIFWLLGLAGISTGARAQDCEALAALSLGYVAIDSAAVVAAGAYEAPPGPFGRNNAALYASLPEFCRVEATSRPTRNSEIGIEVWLPANDWNGRLLGVGNGAWAGSIGQADLAGGVASGYAVAGTDTGHRGRGPGFALEHQDKLVDFAHRSVHEMTVTAKAIVAAYYGRAQERAIFRGCSTGGLQALAEVQRYPDDYDGVIAGDPNLRATHVQGTQMWITAISNRSDAARIAEPEWDLVNRHVIATCDDIDGVVDGVIENPRQCSFDPSVLVCPAGGVDCLNPEQVETFRSIYRGPLRDDGASLFPGLERGSENGWNTLSGAEPMSLARETYEQLVFNGTDWDWREFDAQSDIAEATARIGPIMDMNDANIGEFIERGGKLLLYHGWNDPGIPPGASVRYYEDVLAAVGVERSENAVKLFMVPGMGHCRGGNAPDRFDAVGAIEQWLDTGDAPDRIEAQLQVEGITVRSRPLCPYPAVAVYDGSGDTDEAASFSCR